MNELQERIDDLNTLIEQINDKERDYLDRWSDVEKSATIIQSLISMIKLDVLELLVKYKFDMKNLDLAMEEHHLSSNAKYLFDPDIINEGKTMRTDSNMENIKFLLDSMELNETYMDDPRHYVPVFEKIVLGLKPIVKSKDVNPQDFAVRLDIVLY